MYINKNTNYIANNLTKIKSKNILIMTLDRTNGYDKQIR